MSHLSLTATLSSTDPAVLLGLFTAGRSQNSPKKQLCRMNVDPITHQAPQHEPLAELFFHPVAGPVNPAPERPQQRHYTGGPREAGAREGPAGANTGGPSSVVPHGMGCPLISQIQQEAAAEEPGRQAGAGAASSGLHVSLQPRAVHSVK